MNKEQSICLVWFILVFVILVLTFVNFSLEKDIKITEGRLALCQYTYHFISEKYLSIANLSLGKAEGGAVK